MFSHTLFSLPFALMTMFIASNGLPKTNIILYSLLALVAARTGANAFNRYADRYIDAINPRTANRHIPSGRLKNFDALLVTIISYLIYFFAAYNINTLCFYFSIFPIIIFTIYPYTKRYTYLCHLILGVACSLAVLGAWMAVKGELFFLYFNEQTKTLDFISLNIIPIIIFIAVALWNAGFDTIYGTQDIEFDRKNNIYSIPAKFGFKKALIIARIFHFIMILLLSSLVLFTNLSYIYLLGLLFSSLFLLLEHKIVRPNNPFLMKLASYKLNQIISLTIFVFSAINIFFI